MKHCVELKTKSCPSCTSRFGKLKGPLGRNIPRTKANRSIFLLYSIQWDIRVSYYLLSRRRERTNEIMVREKEKRNWYIYIYIYACQFPLTPSPSSIVRRRGPALREDRHTTLCVSDQGNNRTRGRRTEDEEEWTARSCAREAATENTDTFRESYFSHPASPATYF